MIRMYYYTSTDTMCKILQNGNLFATNIKYMNDAQEYINGLSEIKEVCSNQLLFKSVYKDGCSESEITRFFELIPEHMTEENLKKYMEDDSRYSISFCQDKDLLSQWTTYARESGVSIAMAFEPDKDMNFWFFDSDSKSGKRTINYKAHPEKILYLTKGKNGNHYTDTAKQVLLRMFPQGLKTEDISSKLLQNWKDNSVYIKQYDFYQEQEYRIAFNLAVMDQNGKNPRIDYRVDKHVIKPYLDVKCENGWPVISIMVGPGFNQQIVYRSVKFFLDHSKIESSMLCTQKQWAEQILNYIKLAFPSKRKMPGDWEEDFIHFSNYLKQMADGHDSANIADEERYSLYEKVNNLTYRYLNTTEDLSDKNYSKPYFSKNGIILECSQIPYIY